MYKQHDQVQMHTFMEATKLAAAGEEFSHLITLLNPEYALRLKIFVQQLPESIQSKTIYGRANCNVPAKPAKSKR
jgi:hypothetical protein